MATRNVVLTERQEKLIETLVEGGRYQNASEVLREGLRLIEQREAEESAKLAALKEAAKIGMASVESGSARTFSEPSALRRHLKGVAAKAIAISGRVAGLVDAAVDGAAEVLDEGAVEPRVDGADGEFRMQGEARSGEGHGEGPPSKTGGWAW